MGIQGLQNYHQCDGGAGTDDYCVRMLNGDRGACCYRMVLRNMPSEPSKEEAVMISKIGLMQGPLYENTPEHLCVGT